MKKINCFSYGRNLVFFSFIISLVYSQIFPLVDVVATTTAVVQDLAIAGLDYNTEVFQGTTTELYAYVTDNSSENNIVWRTNKPGVIELNGSGKKASFRTVQTGQVEISACIDDGSYSCIHRNIVVSSYPNDQASQQLVTNDVRAVQRIGINQPTLVVEVNPSLTANAQRQALETYLYQLATQGWLSHKATDLRYPRYAFYDLHVASLPTPLTIRIDQTQASAPALQQILQNVEAYNSPPVETNPSEPQPTPPVEANPSEPQRPATDDEAGASGDLTLGMPEITLVPQVGDGSKKHPFQVRVVGEDLASKMTFFAQYLARWQTQAQVHVLSQTQTATAIHYLLEVFGKDDQAEQPFYIELIIDRETGETVPILSEIDGEIDGEATAILNEFIAAAAQEAGVKLEATAAASKTEDVIELKASLYLVGMTTLMGTGLIHLQRRKSATKQKGKSQ